MSPHRARLRVLVAIATAAGLLLSPAPAQAADPVTTWSETTAKALLGPADQGSFTAGQGAFGVPQLAMVHGAVFDAVNSIDRRYEPYLVRLPAKRWFSQDAAVAAAAHRVLVSGKVVRSDQQDALVAAIEPQYAAALAAIPEGDAKAGGIATGEAAAWVMIGDRAGDGRFPPGPGGFVLDPPGPGVWEPTLPAFVNDPGAFLKDVRPFLLRHPRRFLSGGPLPLESRRYAKEFNEVKRIGKSDSATRTGDQTIAARFWGGPTNAVFTWTKLIRDLAGKRPLSTVESARFYALIYLTAADTAIVTWKDKDQSMFWRPITAIQRADTDDNPATERDKDWLPLIATPPYPDHPSGLSAFGASNVATAQELFRTDDVEFGTTNTIGIPQTYQRLSDAIEQIVDARVWSGIHFRAADVQGARIGRDVARWRRDQAFLRPLHHR